MCGDCIEKYRNHADEENVTCPLCREPIVQDFYNYDLLQITERVKNDDNEYWCKRLIAVSSLSGEEISVHDEMKPFAKLICTRAVYSTEIVNMGKEDVDTWDDDKILIMDIMTKAFIKGLRISKLDFDASIMWVKILFLPPNCENLLLSKILSFYDVYNFLTKMDGEWVMDMLM
jgi:hypothetical protein